ncbi:Neuronal tyrosine-phosphorylated phosphoinositide-3-kinase adapter 1 [Dissostichus eleginoides]|uniref:Neuronal tyrosine-phosphorylated phosphoinositide-3-kinase adapter 1 n=1 Tax=Dissostichus eleginoides TaxID=100907 RepID=A0AAD9EVG3_DISEL|nr:Neuronal tyrosine-phosphorylated phosphoinositide-3-kinase adapter 1 [Dissostichus eleginoides]
MSSGSAQDVAVEHFLRDIERRSKRLHCAVIGCEEERPRSDMNLLYRKSRLDWRQRDQEGSKKSSNQSDPSATVGKVRDLASFRRHFRMGFMTMPASQDLSPHSCASAMAPRSQSCHAVGAGDSLENGDDSDTQSQHGGRCPPTKPKRHPSTRLSTSSSDGRGLGDTPPPSSSHSHKHSEKKNSMKKSDSGDMGGKKVPPLKPKRSPSTQLTFDSLPPRVPHSAASLPFQADSQIQPGDGDDEPVYIEMVGQVFTRESQTATPHPVTPVATTPDSDSDQSEAIYEEMKYPQHEDRASHRHPPSKHEKMKSSKHFHVTPSSSSSSSSLPRPSSSSPSYSKPKATVSISHSSPLPSSASSTPVPQVLSTSPHTPRAPTPYLLQGSKSDSESNTKIPAPFPNLLQHRPPLLAFPQPAAASSGVGVQNKSSSAKMGTQTSSVTTQASSSSTSSIVPSSGSKESSGRSESQQDKHSKDSQLGPAPGLRARSHSTPLPPSSKSTSPFSHHHHHPHHRPSHYHHYRKPERGDSPAPLKGSSQSQSTVQTQTSSTGREGKSLQLHPKATVLVQASSLSPPSSLSHSSRPASVQAPLLRQPSAVDLPLWWFPETTGVREPERKFSHAVSPSALQPRGGVQEQRWLFVPPFEEDEGRAWNGSADALLRMDKEDMCIGSRGGHSGIPVHFSSSRAHAHSESLAGMDSSSGFRALPRLGLPLPCQTFPACRNGEVGRLGRSSSSAGVRQVGGGDVQRQSSLPAREALNQLHGLAQPQVPCSPGVSRQQQQLQLHQQQLQLKQKLQQLQQQHHLQLQFQQLAQLAQGHPPVGGGSSTSASQSQRDGKLLEVIERKRCLCKEIKAHRRPDKSLCKQDSMPILPSWRRTPEPRKTGTPPCQRPQAVVWDTAI